MNEDALSTAVVAAVNAVLPTAIRAYKLGSVPATLPDTYVEVSAHRRFLGEGARSDGGESLYAYRILTRRVAKAATNVDTLAARLDTALDFADLTVGTRTTVVSFESADIAAPDDGRYSAVTYWTCSLPIDNPK